MGVSTDAILFYGYCWDEEINLFKDNPSAEDVKDGYWIGAVALRRGHKDPWDDHPSFGNMTREERDKAGRDWVEKHRKEIDNWNSVEKSIREEFACQVYTHCSDECAMPFLCVEESRLRVARGCPEKLDLYELHLKRKPEWDDKLDAFLRFFDIKQPENQAEPSWWLVSYWG